MLASIRDTDLAEIWLSACLLGGLILVALRARAAGIALWSAVIGSLIGFNSSPTLDYTPYTAMIGAATACFGGGLLGLMWRSSASPVVLRVCGSAVICVGALSAWALSALICPEIRFPKDCVYELSPRWVAMFALDATWVAALCFIQGIRWKGRSPRSPSV